MGCKAFKHRPKQTSPQAHVISPTNTESPMESKLTQLFENLQTQMDNTFTSLSTKIEKVEKSVQPTAPGVDPKLTQGGVFGTPAVVNALPSQPQISDLNLATKHILWAPVTSAGAKLPLPLDSCCSLSLVSQIHAELVSQKCPHLSYKKLATPLSVSVANPDSQLKAVGIMQIPITWENGICSTFSMLVVPNLIWAILFGQNHLKQTKAITDHDGLRVRFNHPSMNFEIKCGDSNPIASFPHLSSQTSNSRPCSSAHVACLLTAVPPITQPKEHVTLHRGFNLVTLCLVMASTLIGNPLFSTPLWLEGGSLFPGVQGVSGPIGLHSLASTLLPSPPHIVSFLSFPYQAITTQSVALASPFQNLTSTPLFLEF